MKKNQLNLETYSEPSQTSEMEIFAITVNHFKPLTIFGKSSILDVWLGSEYASAIKKPSLMRTTWIQNMCHSEKTMMGGLERLAYRWCDATVLWLPPRTFF